MLLNVYFWYKYKHTHTHINIYKISFSTWWQFLCFLVKCRAQNYQPYLSYFQIIVQYMLYGPIRKPDKIFELVDCSVLIFFNEITNFGALEKKPVTMLIFSYHFLSFNHKNHSNTFVLPKTCTLQEFLLSEKYIFIVEHCRLTPL